MSEREQALRAELSETRAENARLRAALRDFVERVDAGEIRSNRTYRQFLELLADVNPPEVEY